MINNKTIETIYKKYRNRPASIDELNIPLLFEAMDDENSIEIKGHDIVKQNLYTIRSDYHASISSTSFLSFLESYSFLKFVSFAGIS